MTQQSSPNTAPPTAQVTDPEELAVAMQGPALFANKFYVTGFGPNTRIAFCEQQSGQLPHFRTAVLLTTADLLRLGQVISQLAKSTTTIEVKTGS